LKRKVRILILEESPADAALVEEEFKNAKIRYSMERVDTKDAFLKALTRFKPDVILSDYSLPQFDSMSALRLTKKHCAGLPFIIVTGAINEETAVECMKAGAADYVLKDRLGRLIPAVQGALAKFQAMEEKHQAEEALIASEMRYRKLFESAREGILLMDAETNRITDINPYMLGLMECGRKAVTGKTLDEIGIKSEGKTGEKLSDQIKASDVVHINGIYLISANGSRSDLEMTCSTYAIDTKRKIQCNIRDISDRKQGEEEKEKIRAQLFQAQKMEAIGTLAGGVAHDFNNLMTAIQVSTDVALLRLDESDPMCRELKEIRYAALRASSLIRQLLLFSRKQLMEFLVVNVNTTVENLLKMLHRLIGEDIQIQTELAPDLWTIQADAGNIEQVIMNLALNARDAMPSGGNLIIKTENMQIDDAFCKTMADARPGQFVSLTIEDTGVGIGEDVIPRIFEPFFTTKGPGQGTGLGLSVVYGIVKQHRGWIQVSSILTKGSAFRVFIPAVDAEEDMPEEQKVSIKDFYGKGERILLVEDEEKVRESANKAMTKCGYRVIPTSNSMEALDVFHQENGRFDLVFSDVVLSDGSGIELAEELLTARPDVNILLCSGYTDQKSQWPLIRDKGFRFLQKPYTLPDLLKALQNALHGDVSHKE